MLFALPCDLALVSFVRRICFGIGRDSLTIRICTKKGLHFIDEMTHCRRPLQNGVWISYMDGDGVCGSTVLYGVRGTAQATCLPV